jgi:hypothetical protein
MLNRSAWIAVAGAAVLALIVGLAIGGVVFAEDVPPSAAETDLTSSSAPAAADSPTSTSDTGAAPDDAPLDIAVPPDGEQPPAYGSDEERQALLDVANGLDITGVFSEPELLLATADKVCYDLKRLIAQGRSPAYATRVVWNESLAELDSEDLAGFATVFSLAPTYLCPEYALYAEEVAYILGI